MAEANGGTSGGTQDTFTQDDLDKAVAKAVEETAASTKTEVFREAQSGADKQIAEIRNTATQAVAAAQTALSGVNQEQETAKLATMTAEERTAFYLAKLVDQGGAKGVVTVQTPPPTPSGATQTESQSAEAEARTALEETATKLGLDPKNLDFDHGPEGLFKTVIAQAKASMQTDEEKAAAANAANLANRNANQTGVQGQQTGTSMDELLKLTPAEIIRKGKDKSPWDIS